MAGGRCPAPATFFVGQLAVCDDCVPDALRGKIGAVVFPVTERHAQQCAGVASLQVEVRRWRAETFEGRETSRGLALHLREEVDELLDDLANDRDPRLEVADLAILLDAFVERRGIDLAAAIAEKHAINRTRKWHPPDADGVVRHRGTTRCNAPCCGPRSTCAKKPGHDDAHGCEAHGA